VPGPKLKGYENDGEWMRDGAITICPVTVAPAVAVHIREDA
jgi:hypothetical protein